MGIEPGRIFEALKRSWEEAISTGSKVLALTVPECSAKSTSLDRKRNELNAHILSHRETN
jgi:hypothetical protein